MITWTEAKQTYKELFRKYPDTTALFTDKAEEKTITEVITNSVKIGGRWKTEETKETEITAINYFNAVDPATVRFFRNLGGTERVTVRYTKYGKIPAHITSISPTGDRKTERTYRF